MEFLRPNESWFIFLNFQLILLDYYPKIIVYFYLVFTIWLKDKLFTVFWEREYFLQISLGRNFHNFRKWLTWRTWLLLNFFFGNLLLLLGFLSFYLFWLLESFFFFLKRRLLSFWFWILVFFWLPSLLFLLTSLNDTSWHFFNAIPFSPAVIRVSI